MQEKGRSVNFKGSPVTLVGPEIKVGQKSPDFILIDSSMKGIHSIKTKGKVKLLSVVLSIETPVCDTQTQSFDKEAGKYSNVAGYSISMDLPFCQERYRKERQVKNLKMLSDHREASFGSAYGLLIKEMRLLARAVFIIDSDDKVRYVEYVPEVTQQLDLEKASAMLKKIVAGN